MSILPTSSNTSKFPTKQKSSLDQSKRDISSTSSKFNSHKFRPPLFVVFLDKLFLHTQTRVFPSLPSLLPYFNLPLNL